MLAADLDHEVVVGDPLTVGDGRGQDLDHAGSPLTAATSTGSWAVAVTPGNRVPAVARSTSVSPSDGRTCSM